MPLPEVARAFRGGSAFVEAGHLRFDRLRAVRDRYLPEPLRRVAEHPSGMYLEIDGGPGRLELDVIDDDGTVFDLECPDVVRSSEVIRGTVVFELADRGRHRLWMPVWSPTAVVAARCSASLRLVSSAPGASSWAVVGTSIEQGRGVSRPTASWPLVAARLLDRNLLNLGFAGQGMLDQAVAAALDPIPLDRLTVSVGINHYLTGAMRPRSFGPALEAFVLRVIESRKDLPVELITPLGSGRRAVTPSEPRLLPAGLRRAGATRLPGRLSATVVGPTLDDYRAEIDAVGEHLCHAGFDVRTIDGRHLLDDAEFGLLPDGLHPGDVGASRIAERYVASA